MVAALFLILNVISLQCVLRGCSALQDGGNTLQAWIVFEGITLFFTVASAISLIEYFHIRQGRLGED